MTAKNDPLKGVYLVPPRPPYHAPGAYELYLEGKIDIEELERRRLAWNAKQKRHRA